LLVVNDEDGGRRHVVLVYRPGYHAQPADARAC
jgi:hypothetical protein